MKVKDAIRYLQEYDDEEELIIVWWHKECFSWDDALQNKLPTVCQKMDWSKTHEVTIAKGNENEKV